MEDCVQRVPNRFELVLLAAQRTRELGLGTRPTVDADRDKRTVLALRGIAAGSVSAQALRDALIEAIRRAALGLRREEEVDAQFPCSSA